MGGFFRWDPVHPGWIPLTDRFRREQSNWYGGEGLALDPSDPRVVYIAAGKYGWSSLPGTLFKSTNQGRTWRKLPIDLKMGGNEDQRWAGPRLVVSPLHPSVLLFGSRHDGLWRSANRGESWSRVSAFTGHPQEGAGITSLAFSPNRAGMVFAAAYGDGVYMSQDEGMTWRRTENAPVKTLRLAVSSDNTLYATHEQGASRFAGDRWNPITPPGGEGGFGGLTLNPRDPKDILIAAQKDRLSLYRSRDGGASWKLLRYETHSSVPWYAGSMKQIQYVSGLTFDPCVPGRLWLSDWYATYRSDNIDADPLTLTNFERGHEELVVFSMLAPPKGYSLLSGVADVDGFVHETLDRFPTRGLGEYYGGSGPAFGDTLQIAPCPDNPMRIARVGIKRWDNTGGGALSRDGGKTWTPFASWDAKIRPARIALSAGWPENMVVLRIGPGSALSTKDGGATWNPVAGLPDNPISDVWNWQIPPASDGLRPGVFYTFQNGTLYCSRDGGASFQAGAGGLRGGPVALVSVPGQGGELWLALESGLYRSHDAGQTFHRIASVKSASLFAMGKAAPGVSAPTAYLYGTLADGRDGIFRSVDNGVQWEAIQDAATPIGDEPNSMTASWRTFGLVFIGTNGRGIYYGTPATTAAR